MPQLDKFTYFSQFFWLCTILFTFYIAICNDGDGILGISRILKLRNQLLSHRENKIQSKDQIPLEDISKKSFHTGISYMYSSLKEVSQWSAEWNKSGDFLGKRGQITFLSSFGEISGSRGIERTIPYLISKSSYQTSPSRITCGNNERMRIHLLNGQSHLLELKKM
nr:ATPase subunit 8 [Chlorophytum comosum]